MRPTNLPLPFDWQCPTCNQPRRAIEWLCLGCFTPRPFLPASLRPGRSDLDRGPGGHAERMAGLWPTFDLAAPVDALVASLSRQAPDAAALLEPWFARLTGLAHQWGDLLPLALEDASPHAQHLHRRLSDWLDGLMPVIASFTERLQGVALDSTRWDQSLGELIAALQGVLQRLEDVAHQRAHVDDLRRQLQQVIGRLLPLVGLR